MNFIAAVRSSNCRGLRASLLRLHLSFVIERTPKRVHKSQFEQKNVVAVFVIVIVVAVVILAINGTMS